MTPHSCSTFLLSQADHLLVGHNLDDYIPVPGLIFINLRGITKQNISWDDLRLGRTKSRPRIQWVSKFRSVTCNAFGKEFPDGGLNEAGLYVGEMTLLGTVYPPGDNQPKIYHHQWIQYLLDNFVTVDQVLVDLEKVAIEGHCQWHFFIADEKGQAAIIEFIEGKTIIHTGESMPVKVLCNTAYDDELATLREYEDFGGHNQVDFGDKTGPSRFVQAATMLQQCPHKLTPDSALDYAFTILQQLDCGNNKWKIVFNIHERRMYYRTWLAEGIRSVNLTSFDLSGGLPVRMLDINQGNDGDTSRSFIPYNEKLNRHCIKQMWKGINMGFVLNTFFKPMMVKRLSNYPKTFEAP